MSGSDEEHVQITSRDFWVKVVEMLQQNWALAVDLRSDECLVFFIDDNSRVFDELLFSSRDEAEWRLDINGFRRHSSDSAVHFLEPPCPPFCRGSHPSGPIYSSGMYWS
jgi:hypothetical protein